MRTVLAAVLLAILIVTGVAIVVPLIARPLVVSAVQSASPFGDQPLEIEVDLNVFGLVAGTVDRVRVRGSDLRRGDVAVAALDVTLRDVATSGPAFRDVKGTLALINVPVDDGGSLMVDRVELGGSSAATTAMATLDRDAAVRLIQVAFADGGIDVTGVELGQGTVAFEVFGARVEVPIGVEDGVIVVVDPFGTGSFEIVRPGTDDGWRFTGAAITRNGMTIDARIDVARLLGVN